MLADFVGTPAYYGVLGGAVVVLIAVYVIMRRRK
jgi:hypothetical protein